KSLTSLFGPRRIAACPAPANRDQERGGKPEPEDDRKGRTHASGISTAGSAAVFAATLAVSPCLPGSGSRRQRRRPFTGGALRRERLLRAGRQHRPTARHAAASARVGMVA